MSKIGQVLTIEFHGTNILLIIHDSSIAIAVHTHCMGGQVINSQLFYSLSLASYHAIQLGLIVLTDRAVIDWQNISRCHSAIAYYCVLHY